MKVINTALIGLGSVNKNLISIINDKKELLSKKYGVSFKYTLIADSSGVAVNNDGFDGPAVVSAKERGTQVKDMAGYVGANTVDVMALHQCDLVFEASPVNFETGGDALIIAKNALKRGISMVFANKGPVVLAHTELHNLAAQNDAGIKYSATVCGGLPILNIGTRDMIAGDIVKFSGVFNGTCNFILDALKNGMPFNDAIKQAQDVGAAEADPSLDVDGWDTAFKLLIIANTVLGANISLKDIDVTGIRSITSKMLIVEEGLGNSIKLVASFEDGKYSVKPTVISKETFVGSCNGWEMGIEIHSDIYGIMYHKLYEKEPIPTAASMMRDAVNLFN